MYNYNVFRKFTLLGCLAILMLLSSCGSDDEMACTASTGDLTINIKLSYDGEPMVVLDPYTYLDSIDIYFTDFNFYLSNLEIYTGTEWKLIKDIDRLNIGRENTNLDNAIKGFDYTIPDVGEGSYESIRFGIGVPPEMNSKDPSDYAVGHPLSLTGEHWLGWSSFVFSKLEGKIEINNSGDLPGIALHTGGDDALRTKQIERSFEIISCEETIVELNIDLKKILINNGEVYDLLSDPQIHVIEQMDLVTILADNYLDAIQ